MFFFRLSYQPYAIRFCANMAELVDATDLKSVGNFSRAGSIPAFRTILKNIPLGVFFSMERVEALLARVLASICSRSVNSANAHRVTLPKQSKG